jgi:hypothetical protein
MPSVRLLARSTNLLEGAPKLGFEALEREKNELVRWRHENG